MMLKFMHAVTVAVVVATPSVGATDAVRGLSAGDKGVFCAHDGHEASASYSAAVVAELKRREAGGKSTKDALRDMRIEFCDGSRK